MMKLSVAGINHKSAPVEVREKYSLMENEARRFLERSLGGALREALVLNTCNRTEIYYVAEDEDLSADELFRRALEGEDIGQDRFFHCRGREAVSHLFTVAASLDSQLVGEDEIQGQIKDAYRLAHEVGTTGAMLNKLFHRAFRVGKRVRSETMLNEGYTSISRAAVELSQQVLGTLEDKRVLLLGAGQTARRALLALVRMQPALLAVANRTPERARDMLLSRLREACGAHHGAAICPAVWDMLREVEDRDTDERPPEVPHTRMLRLEEVRESLADFDLVICSTGSRRPVLTREECAGRLAGRKQPLLIIDIAVPRDVSPELGELPGVVLRNIDELNRLVDENLERRREEMPKARRIVDEEVEKFDAWLDARKVVPTIKLLRSHVNEIRDGAVERYSNNFQAADREELEKFARSLCRKILHAPVSYLQQEAKESDKGEYAEAAALLRRVFRLTEKPEKADGERQ